MDPAWITAGVLIVMNIFGWGVTYGRLNGRIKSLERTTERHEKILNNGLVQELAEVKSNLAKLEGTIQTYIGIMKENIK